MDSFNPPTTLLLPSSFYSWRNWGKFSIPVSNSAGYNFSVYQHLRTLWKNANFLTIPTLYSDSVPFIRVDSQKSSVTSSILKWSEDRAWGALLWVISFPRTLQMTVKAPLVMFGPLFLCFWAFYFHSFQSKNIYFDLNELCYLHLKFNQDKWIDTLTP